MLIPGVMCTCSFTAADPWYFIKRSNISATRLASFVLCSMAMMYTGVSSTPAPCLDFLEIKPSYLVRKWGRNER